MEPLFGTPENENEFKEMFLYLESQQLFYGSKNKNTSL